MSRYINAERMPSDKFWEDLTDKEKAKVLNYLLASPTVNVEEIISEEWISVNEELPKKGQCVLISDGICIRTGELFWSYALTGEPKWITDGGFFENVTHWMPSPKPPKIETESE